MRRLLILTALIAGCSQDPEALVVSQKDKQFEPTEISLQTGEPVILLNDDSRTHNIRVNDPAFKFDSGAQEPGQRVELRFTEPGRYYVVCGIHPKMKLEVSVRP